MRNKHVHVRRNFVPHSFNLRASCVVPCPVAELGLCRTAVNLSPGYCGELVFEVDNILAVRTHELSHRIDSHLSAQMVEEPVMIASNKNNPLELLRLLTYPSHSGLGLFAASIACQVARMDEHLTLGQRWLGVVRVAHQNKTFHLLTVAQMVAQASQYKPLRQSPAMAYAAAMTTSPAAEHPDDYCCELIHWTLRR